MASLGYGCATDYRDSREFFSVYLKICRTHAWNVFFFFFSKQNGRVVDGLSLFKKNVSLHFAGQVECPICYS